MAGEIWRTNCTFRLFFLFFSGYYVSPEGKKKLGVYGAWRINSNHSRSIFFLFFAGLFRAEA